MPTRSLRGSLQGYSISRHAVRRMKERGFRAVDLEFLADQGECQELDTRLTLYSIPESPFIWLLATENNRRRLAGSSVLVDDSRSVVVTVYWSNDPDLAINVGEA